MTDNINLGSFDLDSIIGSVLGSAVAANNMLSREQIKFLLDFCFYKEEGSDIYHPVIINMTITKSEVVHKGAGVGSPSLEAFELPFSVPLITLIPLNSLMIDSISLNFGIEVSHAITESEEEFQPKVFGKITTSKKNTQSSEEEVSRTYTSSDSIDVDVIVNQSGLPNGVLVILNLYSNAINPIED